MIKYLILIVLTCTVCQYPHESKSGWQKIYANDPEGNTTFGKKSQLIEAVRLGYPVRIGWGSTRVEHVAEAEFLTIFQGEEVFAQINAIVGQAPRIDGDSLKIRFRMKNHWTKIAGTNGYSTAFMTDYLKDTIVGGGNDRYTGTTWYVNYPPSRLSIEARPLWRKESPLWGGLRKKLQLPSD